MWSEIATNLKPRKSAFNAPHLTAQVFKMYRKEIIREIWEDGVLGKCATKLSVIEFQERGLPHAHILIHLQNEDKRIPDPIRFPNLFHTVSNCMMHMVHAEMQILIVLACKSTMLVN